MAFRGYLTKRAWARAKWRTLQRFPRQLRSAILGWWWRAIGFAEKLRRRAEEAEAARDLHFGRARRAEHVAYMLQHPPAGDGSALALAADEVDRQGPNGCDHAWQEGDTGAWNCDRERRGETCWCDVANELRELSRALADAEALNRARADAARKAA